MRFTAAAVLVFLVSAVAHAEEERVTVGSAELGWMLPGTEDQIFRIKVDHFDGGGRARSWLRCGQSQVDLNGSSVQLDCVGATKIQVISCDEAEGDKCKGSVGAWPTTATESGQRAAAATWEIAPGIRARGQATVLAFRVK